MSKDNGGPAFPVAEDYSESQGRYVQYACDGMTLRDYFAAKAMNAMLSRSVPDNPISMASNAYVYADAMLKARAE